jgi:hypothetical protein
MTTLGEELPRQMSRVRDKIMPAYIEIGNAGVPALTMMRRDLDRAAKALAEGDVTAMMAACKSLSEYSL